MLGLLIDVKNNNVSVKMANSLKDYYRLTDCDVIDIVKRCIGGKYYNIICDDEGLLKENIIISAIDTERKPMLVGNLIVAGDTDDEGELLSLTDKDVDNILKHVKTAYTRSLTHPVLVNVEY